MLYLGIRISLMRKDVLHAWILVLGMPFLG
jgi:hypothetical protein